MPSGSCEGFSATCTFYLNGQTDTLQRLGILESDIKHAAGSSVIFVEGTTSILNSVLKEVSQCSVNKLND